MKEIYLDVMPETILEKMKASEIAKIIEKEDLFMRVSIMSVISGFWWLIFLIAWLIWSNKLSLFIFATTSVVFIPSVVMMIIQFVSFKNLINSFVDKYKSEVATNDK